MIVAKAVNMAKLMKIPILGIVENMAFFKCPDCNKEFDLFGKSHINEVAKEHGIEVYEKIPIDPKISKACDEGKIEFIHMEILPSIGDTLEKMEEKEDDYSRSQR